ncbi:MAG: S8 family serine peptidase, partial [Bacteroidota bacterium]
RVRGAYTGGSWGSNYGDHIDVVAPGNSMLSTRYNDNQAFNWWMGGTSQATPLVAGTASLLLGLNPNLSVEEVRTIIRTTADDQVGAASEDTPGFDIYHGAGRLNTHQAVLMASCPPGATCNDGNGNTYNDVYGVNCQCQGTPFSVRLNVNKSEVCAGETAQLQVTTSGLPNAAYRWQWSANGTTWNESSTDPNAPVWNLNVGNLSNDPRWWRVLVTSNGFTTTSHPVKTTVLRAPNISVTNASITSGQSATLTATGYDANGGCFDLTDYIGAIDQRGGLARNGTGVSFNSIRYAGGGFGTNYWDMTVSNAAANHYIDYNYEIPDQDFRNFKTITVGLSYGGNPGFQLFIRDRQQGYTNLGTATGAGGTFDLPSDLARKDDVHLIKIRFRTSDLGGNGTSRRFHLSNIRLCGADFRWSNGATTPSITVSPSSTTNYTATASYGDCSTAQTATVTVATPNQQSRYPAQTANIPGTIQAEYYDLGGQGIAFNDNNTKNGDQNFRSGDNVDCNILSGSNYKVGWTANGEWLEYTVNAQAGTYDIIVAATSGSGGSVGDVRVSLDGMVLGTANIVNTGGWTSPQNFTIPNVNVSGGSNKVLRLTVVNGQGLDIDKVTFTPSGPSCTPGTSCNDGDACTVNDVYDNNCGCSGTFQDSDNDGVCNANDQCPGFDNDLIGTACNDGNPNTINDTYNNSCDCVGQPVSGQTTFWLEAECGNVGSAWTLLNDGGASGGQALTFLGASSTGSAPTAASARIRFNVNISQAGSYEIYTRSIAPNSGDDSYWVRVNNGSWVRFNQVNAPNQNNSWQWDQVGQWNGGANNNPLSFNLPTGNATIDFAYRENGIKFDKVFISLDQSPSGLGATVENCTLSCTPGTACNDGNPCTINDVYDNSCGCSGTFQDSDGDGVCNANDDCPGFNDNLIGTACNDGNPDTDNDVYTADCVCAGTPVSAGGTLTLDAIHDAYLQGSSRYNTTELRVENGNRVSYLMFDISGATGPITSAQLVMEVGSDGGNGVITVHKGSSNNWTETNISNANKPSPIQQLGNLNTSYSGSNTYTWNLTPGAFSGNTVSLIVRHDSGNDVSFKSSENTDVAGRPQLVLEYGNALTTPDNDGSFRAAVLSSEKELRVFPNPFQDELTSRFTASEQTRELFLLDVNGRVLERQVILPGQTQARFTGNEHRLIPSLYLIRLLSPDGSTSRKVMKLR